ncbi:MAG: hypothetical protein ACYST9_05520, partial [Planctomycetota bacterium]
IGSNFPSFSRAQTRRYAHFLSPKNASNRRKKRAFFPISSSFYQLFPTFSNFFPVFDHYLRIWSRQIPIFNLKTKMGPKKHQKKREKKSPFFNFSKK